MASRVNTRFVTILCFSLTALFVTVGVIAAMAFLKSGSKLVRLGDEAVAAREFDSAVELYAKAVRKNQTNIDWINKWIDAMRASTPKTQQLYMDRYNMQFLRLALRSRADIDRSNPQWAIEYLSELYTLNERTAGSNLGSWEYLTTETERIIKDFTGSPEQAGHLQRYAGLAGVRTVQLNSTLSEQQVNAVLTHLEAAAAADPTDAKVVVAISEWHRLAAVRAQAKGQPDQAQQEMDAARKALTDFSAAHSPAPDADFALVQMDLQRDSQDTSKATTVGDLIAAQKDRLVAVADAFIAQPAARIDLSTAIGLAGILASLPGEGVAKAEAVLQHAQEANQFGSLVLLTRGTLLMSAARYDEANAIFEQVAALPSPTLSLEGVLLFELRGAAVRQQCDSALAAWEKSTDATEKAGALEAARKLRDRYVEMMGDNAQYKLLLDAKLKFADGDTDSARRFLSEYTEDRGKNDAEAMALLGNILLRQGNLGAARSQFEQVLLLRPAEPTVLSTLGRIEADLGNSDKAREYYSSLLKLKPGDTATTDAIRLLDEAGKKENSSNPIIATLSKVREAMMREQPDFVAAETILREALAKPETKDTPQLVGALAQVLVTMGKKPDARALIQDVLTRKPDDASLKQLALSLSFDDPVAGTLAMIEQSQDTELGKAISRTEVYRQNRRYDDARKELEKATAIAPNDATVLELRFQLAQAGNDLDEMRRAVDAQASADAAGPRTASMRARLLMAEKKFGEAADLLSPIVQRDSLNYYAWYLLGRCRAAQGQYPQAVDCFKKALEIRPSDSTTAKDLMRVYALQNRLDESLKLARESSDLLNGDDEFVELWMQAEAMAGGGDKSKVLGVRRVIAARNPANVQNRIALAAMLIDMKQWDEAKAAIDDLKAKDPSVTVAQLEAEWCAQKGDVDKAFTTLQDYIDSLPEDKRTVDGYLLLARMMLRFGQIEPAIGVLDQGRRYQSPSRMEADREAALTLFALRRYEDAAGRFRVILSQTKEDKDNAVAKGYVESLMRSGQYDEAVRILGTLGDKATTDPQLITLHGAILAQKGDYDGARKLFDQGVAKAGNDPISFTMRGQFNAMFPEYARDAEADFDRAMKLDPGNDAARNSLVDLYIRTGRWRDAVEQLRKALTANPDNDVARGRLIAILLDQNEPNEATVTLDDVLTRRPKDLNWRQRAGDVYAQLEKWPEAASHYETVWRAAPTIATTLPLLHSLLKQGQAGAPKAAEILALPAMPVAQNVPLLVCRAWLNIINGKTADATADLTAAIALTNPDDQASSSMFFDSLRSVYPKTQDRLTAVLAACPAQSVKGWVAYGIANLRINVDAAHDQGVKDLEAIAATATIPDMKSACYRVLGTSAYARKEFDAAALNFRRTVDLLPDDSELNNNLAYTLAVDLGRPSEGLPYAQKAAAQRAEDPAILDTLGTIHMLMTQFSDAEVALTKAVRNSTGPNELLPATLHLAQLRLKQGNRAEADRYLREADAILKVAPELENNYRKRLDDLRAEAERP